MTDLHLANAQHVANAVGRVLERVAQLRLAQGQSLPMPDQAARRPPRSRPSRQHELPAAKAGR